MALTQAEVQRVTDVLDARPELPSGEVRKLAGLGPKQTFDVMHLRRKLGVPEPGKVRAGGKTRKPAATVETLEDDAPEASEPKRSQAGLKPKSMLAPVMPRMARIVARSVMHATANMTRGQNGMSRDEAVAVAVPTMRILDRIAAKYIRHTGAVTANQEDIALIAGTVGLWLLESLMAAITGARRAARAPAPQPAPVDSDLFSGSEPAAPSPRQPAQAPAAQVDDSDLFAGSEPLAASAVVASAFPGRNGSGPADAIRLSDDAWAQISPPDLGDAPI